MLGKQILAEKVEDNNNKDNVIMNSESKSNGLLINWTPYNEKMFFLQHGSPRVLSKSVPRRNKSLLRCRINRSLNFDVIHSRKNSWFKSSNSSLDDGDSFDKNKLSRDLSRSAKIMRALSFDHNSLSHRNMSIKRSLNFDLTPSPEKSNSISNNSHMDSINAPLSNSTSSSLLDEFVKLETNSSNSTANSALDSMDENQNQTPKQNRKIIKISNDRTSDTKESVNDSESSCSTSPFPNSFKDNTDNMICMTQTPDLQSLKRYNRSRAFNCVIMASTPRNLFQEFDQNEDNRSCTPENVMRLIPQSISSIKKSHKKEKLHCNEEESFTRQINVSIRKEKNTNIQTLESLKTDVFTNASCSNASIIKSQKKNKSVKKTLIYDLDDKLLDTTSGFDAQWKAASKKNDLPESRSNKTENAEIQGIDPIDCEKSDEDSGSIHFESHNSNEKNCSNESSCDKEVHQPSLQEESLNICGANENETSENREVSTESNSPASQSFNGAATPENSFNILEHLFTESIKKSHKKIKHENRKALFKTKFLHNTIAAESEITAQDTCNNDQCEDIKNKTTDAVCISGSQNSNRPSTPENINSSRLLLPLFKSVKKSHKKDKHGKKIYSFSKSYNYEDLTNSKISCRNKSLRLNESPDISGLNKRRRSKNMSLQSTTCELPSLKYKDASDEFKIYTPIKRMSSSLFTNRVYEDKTSQKDSVQMTSEEIDCSRCITPVIRIHNYSGKLRESSDLISEECTNIKKFVTDASVLKDRPANTIDLKNKNGRSTPIHMSTTELLDNVNSIKKSHKKDKHDRSVRRRRVLGKEQSFTRKSRNGNVASSIKVLEEHNTSLPFKSLNVDNHCTEMEIYSNILDEKQNENYSEIVQGSPQPSTSQGSPQPSTSQESDNTQDATNVEKSDLLSTTPSNDVSAVNLIKMFHTTSIKKSHRKERDDNAQAKYILMSKEHEELSDGSIFDEDDRLHFTESYNSCQDSDEMII